MGGYQGYAEYRDSGVEWLGEAPKHWEIIPVGRLYRRVKRTGCTEKELLSVYRDYGVIPKYSRDDNNNKPSEDLSPYQLVKIDDLVMNKMKTWQGSIAISEYEGIVSPAYFVYPPLLRSNELAYPRYIHYLLRSPVYIAQYLRRSKGIRVNQWDLDPAEFQKVELLLPRKEEQNKIFNFLDHETAKIDTLIEKQKKLIALLKEKRQAVISHAVTKGLNPDVVMRDSGVEWLGEVPEGWDVMQIRRILPLMEQGKSPECDNKVAGDNEWGVLKTSCVNNGVYNSAANKALPDHVEPFPQYEVKKDDVLMSRASGSVDLIGSVALVHETRNKILLSDKVFRLHLDHQVNRVFFSFLMRSLYMRANIERTISGAEGMANNITKSAVVGFKIAVPPLHEQQLIADLISKKLYKFSGLIQKSECVIALMQERRTALISSAVTGKIDVRNWQAPLQTKPNTVDAA
ncbi:restriction endonuclease subunit S [Desulfoluna sp.]|uniref:restriction endonuclease subunit S n=1 Tax=Desulfoluna sp. TaxID=2045199 RepID=UPI002603F8B1|nr:restriction endonuclease subunit S [Desulfoluna sp.]